MKRLCDTENFVTWESKGFLAKKLTTPTDNDNGLFLSINLNENLNFHLISIGSCLKRNKKKATFTTSNIIIFFIVHELDAWSPGLDSDFVLTLFKIDFFGLLIDGVGPKKVPPSLKSVTNIL